MKGCVQLLNNSFIFLLVLLWIGTKPLASQEISAWGYNGAGQLGLGDTSERHVPTTISGLSGVQFIACGEWHTLALMSDGTLEAWGYNAQGQLGLGDITQRHSPTTIPDISRVQAVAGGRAHSLALMSDGTLKAWGYNGAGQLGLGDTINRYSPATIPNLSGVQAIVCEENYSLALMNDGTVKKWGNGVYSPATIPDLSGVQAIAGGEYNRLALMNDGTVKEWRGGEPATIPNFSGVQAIAGGGYHFLALMSDGTLKVWGNNELGQLGLGDTSERYVPTTIPGLSGVQAIAGGVYHSVALMSDGTLKAWGNNDDGQLGLGDTSARHVPTTISGLSGAQTIACGYWYTLAINGGGSAGTLKFGASTYSVNENAGSVTLSVTRTGGSSGAASVNYTTVNGAAIAGTDYTATFGTLSWADGNADGKTITVPILDDSTIDGHKIFTVTLNNASGASLGSPSSATVTIVDNETPNYGSLQFVVSTLSVYENAGSVTLSVTRTGGSSGAASVNYTTVNGAAIAGTDYTATSGTLSWADGNADGKTITVPILDDSTIDGHKIFTVTLNNASGASLGSPSSATVTIVDNESPQADNADLALMTLLFLPATLTTNQHPGAVSVQLINFGPQNLAYPNTRVAIDFYLSANTTFEDADDISLGYYTTDQTLDGSRYTTLVLSASGRQGLTVPATVTSGTYNVFARVRHAYPSILVDPDESNNYVMREGAITVTGIPDGGTVPGYHVINDYDGDGKSDIAFYKESTGGWMVLLSGSGYTPVSFVFGGPGYEPVIADYDGDGKCDPAIYNRITGDWWVMFSAQGHIPVQVNLSGSMGMPVPIDYDGDGKADPAVYQESTGTWVMYLSGSGYAVQTVTLGGIGRVPVPADYDGDGISDIAVYRTATGDWSMLLSSLEYWTVELRFGGSGSMPVPTDYDGDGKADPGTYKKSSGEWNVMMSRISYLTARAVFGGQGWVAVPADFDGDGQGDVVVYKEPSAQLQVLLSGSDYHMVEVTVGGPGYEPVGVWEKH